MFQIFFLLSLNLNMPILDEIILFSLLGIVVKPCYNDRRG